MSVIHEALKSKRQNKAEDEPTQIIEEGLFLGKKSLVIEPKFTWPKLKPYVFGLCGLLIIGFLYLVIPKVWYVIHDLIPDTVEEDQKNQNVVIEDHEDVMQNPKKDISKIDRKEESHSLPDYKKKDGDSHQANSNKEFISGQDIPQQQIIDIRRNNQNRPSQFQHRKNLGSIEEANALFSEGRYDESLEIYKVLSKSGVSDYQLYNNIGMIYLKKELYSISENYFSKALEYNSECASCFNNLGYLKTIIGQYSEAEVYLKKSLDLESNQTEVIFNLAVMHEKSGEFFQAVKFYSQFLTLGQSSFPPDIVNDVEKRIEELTGQSY